MTAQDFEKDTELAGKYYQKGVELKNRYQLDSADYYLKSAAELFKKHEVWDNYLIIQNEVGTILLRRGEQDAAIGFFETQLSVAAEHFEAANEYSANFYNNLGLAHFFKGDVDAALDFYDRSLSIRIALGDKESVFVSNLFNDMGNGYSEKGEFELAFDYYQKSLQIRKKVLGENHPETALSYNNLGIVYKEQGQYGLAIEYHQKALEIQKKIFGEDYHELANYYQGIGNAYKEKGELDLAMDYYMKAYTIHGKTYGETNPLVAKDLVAIGNIYTEKEDYENAVDAFQKALKIQKQTLNENHPDLAMTYNNIGNIYNKNEQLDLALAFYLNALQIKEATVGEEHPEIADYYNNIGNIYSSKGDYIRALEYQQKALDLKVMFFGNKHPTVVLPYLNIGNIYYETSKYDEALVCFKNSLSANVKGFDPEPVNIYSNPQLSNYYDANKLLRSLHGKAKTLVGKFKKDTVEAHLIVAFKTYQKCDTLIGIIRRTTISKSDKIELGKISSKIYDEGIDICSKLHNLKKNTDNGYYLEEGFYFSEKNKAGVLREAIAGAEAKKFSGLPDNLLAIEKKQKEEIVFYEKKLAEVVDAQEEAIIRNELFELKTKYNKLISGFEKDYPKYYEMKHGEKYVTVKELQNNIPENTALRSYFLGDSLISIFTITNETISLDQVHKDEDCDFKIFGLRKLITSGTVSDFKDFQIEAYNFYNKLFPSQLPAGIENVLVIPDGNLGLIPFEVLLTEKYAGKIDEFDKYPFLIKKYGFSYSYSANLFYKNIRKTVKNGSQDGVGSWLGIAPVFNDVKNLIINDIYISSLPASEKEVKTINQKFKQKKIASEIKVFNDASEECLKLNTIKKYKYLHIATHGFVNSEKPELSGIILAENMAGGNDGVLYSGEIYNLELNSDLVVLSACETGLGKVSKGEGIIGLTRALLYAGTNNIIVSLWRVSDNSTADLMIDFYDSFLNDMERKNLKFAYSDYLRMSKLNMIKNEKFGHPFFWSPFILIGN
ncbi:MAG: CHAT domain-containing tetratricopeptide repeat protein [Bacteroidota bacterium]